MNRDFRIANLPPLTGETPTAPRTIDLYGHAMDGRPLLWKRAVQVAPTASFERDGRWIRSGHYVINHNGDAIVAHCGNVGDESVSVQFVHEERTPCVLPHGMIESMLLGKVLMSEEQQAAVFEGRRLSDFFAQGGTPVLGLPNRSH
jgi:hypothetical protein